MKKVLILANPHSGKKESETYASVANNTFLSYGWRSEIKMTQQVSDNKKIVLEAVEANTDYLIIIGGDGTVSETLNALKECSYRPAISILPTGTVNNIAKSLGISTDIDEAIKDITQSVEEKCDVGEVNGKLFLSSISAGTIPETVWEVTAEMKEKYGPLAYFIEGFKALRNEEAYSMEITVNGNTYVREVSILLIGVSHSVVGIPHFFSEATKDDGLFRLLTLNETTFGDKVTIFTKLIGDSDQELLPSDVTIDTFTEAKISLINGHAHVAMDGEKGPDFPLDIKLHPAYLSVLVPRHDESRN